MSDVTKSAKEDAKSFVASVVKNRKRLEKIARAFLRVLADNGYCNYEDKDGLCDYDYDAAAAAVKAFYE